MIITQKRIYREDLQANPLIKYLFGDNTHRKGLGGQAFEMRGNPNAIGIATKKSPSMDPSSFFSDDELTQNLDTIWDDLKPAFAHIIRGGIIVIPLDGLGTGLSKLTESAPRTAAALDQYIIRLYRMSMMEDISENRQMYFDRCNRMKYASNQIHP